MYKVMIVDDEQHIRDRLKSIIEWKALGLALSCEAADSGAALELFMIHRPKIVITDINIPVVSGIELAKQIMKTDPDVRFIIITGFSDFEHSKAALRLGAVDLISKPISPAYINATLIKALEYFEKLKEEKQASRNMRLLLEENLPMIREKFISYVLNSTHKLDDGFSEKVILKKINSLGIDILGKYYTVVLIGLLERTDLSMITVKEISEEIFRDAGYKLYSFYDDYYRLNCVLSWDSGNMDELLEETLQKIHEKMDFYSGITITAGIGMPVNNVKSLHKSRQEAYVAFNYQNVFEGETINDYKNILHLDKPIELDQDKSITQATLGFINGDLDYMKSVIKKELSSMFLASPEDIQPVRKFVFEFISSIIAESISLGINVEMISQHTNIYSKIFAFEDNLLLTQYLFEFTENLYAELGKKRSEKKNLLISMAKDFIDKNLGDENLNLATVSRHIGLSSIYFCKLFHKEEDVSFNNYLNITRINKAKELLSETNLKVFEVGIATGFGNSPHFHYSFKKITGVTPSEYRNSSQS